MLTDLIKNEILENENITLKEVFDILEKYLHYTDIMLLLDIGKGSYYKYKKTGQSKYVEKKLHKFYYLLNKEG